MMRIPDTYADWVQCLEALKAGGQDDEILRSMEQGTVEWTAGVAEKLTQRMSDVLELRLKQASQQMNTEFTRARVPDSDVVRALMNARRRYALMKRFVSIPAFPEQVRRTMSEVLHAYVKDTQAALEESAKHDRTGHLRMLIKNNSLLGYEQVETSMEPAPPALIPNPAPAGTNLRRRRVIL